MSCGHGCPLNDWAVATTSAYPQEPGDHVGLGSGSTGVERGSVLHRGLAWDGTEGLCSPAWTQEDPSSRALGLSGRTGHFSTGPAQAAGAPRSHCLTGGPFTFSLGPSSGPAVSYFLHRPSTPVSGRRTRNDTAQDTRMDNSEPAGRRLRGLLAPGIPTTPPGRDQGSDPLSWARLSVFSNFSSRHVWCFEINTGLKH